MPTWFDILAWLCLAGPAAVACAISAWNLWVWPRGSAAAPPPTGSGDRSVSVLIPARNEEKTIEACVRAAAHSSVQPSEIVVYDDRSTDRTSHILRQLREEFDGDPDRPILRMLEGKPLPDGWVGKPHACHKLANAADGETLVFVDADTILSQDGIARLLSFFRTEDDGPACGARMVTAVPRQQMGTFGERLMIPLLHVTYTSWLPQHLVYSSDDPRCLAANGQVMAMDRDALREVDGFESVRHEVVDDMALARRFKQNGKTVVFADGYHIARCRMYDSTTDLVHGFSKNLYEGIGSSIWVLAGVIGLYAAAFLVPYLVAGYAWLVPASGVPTAIASASLVGVGANTLLRAMLIVRFSHPIEGVILHPLSIVGFIGIALNSFTWHATDSVKWSGRTYSSRSRR